MEPVETINYKGYNIEIHFDDDPMNNPREEIDGWIGKMVCWHNRHQLGDEQPKMDSETFIQELAEKADPKLEDKIYYWENGKGWKMLDKKYPFGSKNGSLAFKIANERIKNLIQKSLLKHFIILPLYLYDHSGITINTGPSSCPWDSGQIGYIYVSIEKIKKEFNWNLLTKNRKQKIIDILETEVKIYDNYLTGNIYGFIINNSKGEEIDSCWGFNGIDWKDNGLLEAAESSIDYYITTRDRIQNELNWFMNNCWAD